MSIPIPIAGLALSVGSSFLQAGMQSQMSNAQTRVMNDQLKLDIENERIKGMQDANDRQEEYLRNESANRVAASVATGGGRNMSYDQGIAKYNKKVAGRDLQTMQFNTDNRIARTRYQISVNRWNNQMTRVAAFGTAASDSLASVGGYMQRPKGLLE